MAIRKKLNHDAETRKKIQTTQIVNRLTKHILGKVDLSSTQVTAALGLLKKTLPDIIAVKQEGSITHTHEHTIKNQMDFNAVRLKVDKHRSKDAMH